MASVKEIKDTIKDYDADANEASRADNLLSPELEALAKECGCRPQAIAKFKLAWSSYDLLNSLGDPSFWAGSGEQLQQQDGELESGGFGGEYDDEEDEEAANDGGSEAAADDESPNFVACALASYRADRRKKQELKSQASSGSFAYLESGEYIEQLEGELRDLRAGFSGSKTPVSELLAKTTLIAAAKERRTMAQRLDEALASSAAAPAGYVRSRNRKSLQLVHHDHFGFIQLIADCYAYYFLFVG